MQNRIILSALILFVIITTSCGYNRKQEVYGQLADVTPHYSSIAAVVVPKCLPCHASGGGAPDFTSYAGVMSHVHAGDSEKSGFYTQVINGEMPIGRPMLNDDEILAIYQWIQNGALND